MKKKMRELPHCPDGNFTKASCGSGVQLISRKKRGIRLSNGEEEIGIGNENGREEENIKGPFRMKGTKAGRSGSMMQRNGDKVP